MTAQDNLRDRIEAALRSATISDGRRAAMVPDCKAMAQAIIDELRLEREVSPINVDCVRYVSKWELRKH